MPLKAARNRGIIALGRIKNSRIPCADANNDGVPDATEALPSLATFNGVGRTIQSCVVNQRANDAPVFNGNIQAEYRVSVGDRSQGFVRGLFTYYGGSQGDPLNRLDVAERCGYAMVDAPVSEGIAAAAGGTLTFMVGGTDEAFARAEPILAAMGKAVIRAGMSGARQAAKICNNMLLGASMIATCETFKLAERLGLDLQTFYDISSQASGQNWSMTSYCPVPGVGPESPADHGFRGGFASALMLKDLRLAMDAARASGARVPMAEQAQGLYSAFVSAGKGGLDFSAIIEAL